MNIITGLFRGNCDNDAAIIDTHTAYNIYIYIYYIYHCHFVTVYILKQFIKMAGMTVGEATDILVRNLEVTATIIVCQCTSSTIVG